MKSAINCNKGYLPRQSFINSRKRKVALLTHPGGLVGADLDGERVVWCEHGGDGGGGVGHADAVRHAARRHRYRCQDLKTKDDKLASRRFQDLVSLGIDLPVYSWGLT